MITGKFQNADFAPQSDVFRGVCSLRLGPEKGQDSKLVREASKGDSAAWHKLVDKYSAYVYTVVRSTGLPEPEEADAFQYVFLELFKSLDKLDRTDSVAPWLRQTAIRHCIRLREKRQKQSASIDDLSDLPDPKQFDDELLKAEQAQQIREAVASLQEKCRDLIIRLFYEDPPEPYSVVAKALGIKPASIGMTRQRCLEALERALRSRGIL